ncbi:A/G-specific adenine glycosylase [Alicyclobacillus mali (ex Roth et al. 2021)]|uniref:A/G-specific adenine glycosylase n=1 Tax=Alicyclobacillus mali (ex Roth et al. 2021) TaxID=1123961 RepID=UPI001F5DAA66|nr:A/G-specific adenine glycosylase [Alicyclobacillus mali (ex Roth et al. 2021)]
MGRSVIDIVQESLAAFAHTLEAWYAQSSRDLPWRHTGDPYAILVSETMLQQTRVETVIPYYLRFMERFRTPRHLADAEMDDVLKMWEGLGYYRRARNLKAAMEVVRDRHAGRIPDEPDELKALPGIGPYTLGAVLSIAFNQPHPAVDGNVLRVMSRYRGIEEPVDLPTVKRRIEQEVAEALRHGTPRVLTQAIMELGALVCVPNRPHCDVCPLAESCAARHRGLAHTLPNRLPKRARRRQTVVALWITRGDSFWAERRPDGGLLGGMWQLPAVELDEPSASLESHARSRLAELCLGHGQGEAVREFQPVHFERVCEASHGFTHLDWTVVVFAPVGYDQTEGQRLELHPSHEGAWVSFEEISNFVWPKVYQDVVRQLIARNAKQLTLF